MEASRGTKEMELDFAITEFTDLGFGFAVGEPLSSEDASCLLFDTAPCTVCFRYESKKWLQENYRQFHDVQQMEKMVPFIASETFFGKHV